MAAYFLAAIIHLFKGKTVTNLSNTVMKLITCSLIDNCKKINSPFKGIIFPFSDIAPGEFCILKKLALAAPEKHIY